MEKNNLSWIILLIAVFFAAYFVGINAPIQEVDPATYAEVSREMVASRNYIFLHDNYRDYLDKPPVTMWLISASYLLFGITNFAVRLPSVLMALVALMAVYWLGLMLWNKRSGLLAALLFASSAAPRLMIQDPKIDMVLIGLMSLSFALLYRGLSDHRFLWPGYAAMALAFLTKGPISIGIPVLAFGAYAFWKHDSSVIKRLKPVRGLLLTAALILPWYLAVALRRGDYTAYFMLFKQSFGRFYAHQFNYGGDDLFYVHTFAWAFLPWSWLFLTMLVQRVFAWRKGIKPDDGELFALWWWILPFIILSLAVSKLPQYIFWLLPPAALLTGHWLDKRLEQGVSARESKVLSVQYLFIALPLILSAIMFLISFPPATALPWGILGAGCALLLALAVSMKSGIKKIVVLSSVSMVVFDVLFSGFLYPAVLKYQPFQVFGKQIRELAHNRKSVILSYRYGERGTLNYYSRMPVRQVDTPREINRYLAVHNPSFFVTTDSLVKQLGAMGYTVTVINSLPFYPTSRMDRCFVLKWDRDKCLTHLSIGTISGTAGETVSTPSADR